MLKITSGAIKFVSRYTQELPVLLIILALPACSSLPFDLEKRLGLEDPAVSEKVEAQPKAEISEFVSEPPTEEKKVLSDGTIIIPDASRDYETLRLLCTAIDGGRCCKGSVAMMAAGNFPLAHNDRIASLGLPPEEHSPTHNMPKAEEVAAGAAEAAGKNQAHCPEGMTLNTLLCPTSFKWCEPEL